MLWHRPAKIVHGVLIEGRGECVAACFRERAKERKSSNGHGQAAGGVRRAGGLHAGRMYADQKPVADLVPGSATMAWPHGGGGATVTDHEPQSGAVCVRISSCMMTTVATNRNATHSTTSACTLLMSAISFSHACRVSRLRLIGARTRDRRLCSHVGLGSIAPLESGAGELWREWSRLTERLAALVLALAELCFALLCSRASRSTG